MLYLWSLQTMAKKVWYCHNIVTPNIPVLGSVGTKNHALAVAKVYNRSIGYLD